MSRKGEEFNPVCGIRVKQIIAREGLTNRAFAGLVHLSEKTVSGMVNLRQKVTEVTAKEIVKAFPEYQVEWILGYTEYMTKQEAANAYLIRLSDDAAALDTAIINLLKLNGWTMQAMSDKDGYVLENREENKVFELDMLEMIALRNDLQGYTKYRLDSMFNDSLFRATWNKATKKDE